MASDNRDDEMTSAGALETHALRDGTEENRDSSTKDELNDSEAETEILSGSRRQTPRKPRQAADTANAEDAEEPDSPTKAHGDKPQGGTAQPLSPKKRKVDEDGQVDEAHRQAASSDEDEEDIVVPRTRAKRARKGPRRRLESEDDVSHASQDDVEGSDSHPRKRPATTLDISATRSTANKSPQLDDDSPHAALHSPRLRSRPHRRSISIHPAATSRQDMSSRNFAKNSSRGSEDPHPERSSSTPAGPTNPPPGVKVDRHGQTPLQGASGKGDLSKVRQILEVAIDPVAYINHQDYAGHTALHAAALKGHSDVVKFLVESGAELNLINKNTDTPLDDAADNSEQEIVDYLLSKGGKHADKTKSQSKPKHHDHFTNMTPRSLLDACKTGSEQDVLRHLEAHIRPTGACIVAAIGVSNKEMLEFLVAYADEPINDTDKEGRSPLDYAAEIGNTEAVNMLKQNGYTHALVQPRTAPVEPTSAVSSRPSTADKGKAPVPLTPKSATAMSPPQPPPPPPAASSPKSTAADSPSHSVTAASPSQSATAAASPPQPTNASSPKPTPVEASPKLETVISPPPAAAPTPPAKSEIPQPPPMPPPPAPVGLVYALANPLPSGFGPHVRGQYNLRDFALPLRHFPRSLIDPTFALSTTSQSPAINPFLAIDHPTVDDMNPHSNLIDDRWVPAYMVSLILGHTDLAQLKPLLPSSPSPVLVPITPEARDSLIWKGCNLQSFAYTTKKWIEMATRSNPGSNVVTQAEGEGFHGCKVFPNGAMKVDVKGPWMDDAKEMWMNMAEDEVYWIRLGVAEELVKEAIGKQERLKDVLFRSVQMDEHKEVLLFLAKSERVKHDGTYGSR